MEKILCAVRIRPDASTEKQVTCEGEKSIQVRRKNDTQAEAFHYDRVFAENTQNDEIFTSLVEPLLQKAFSGYNICVLTYGQTSSGKTHTMKGNSTDPGVVPRTLSWIAHNLQRITNCSNNTNEVGASASAKISYVEIYNETVNDLLCHGNNNLDIVTDAQSKNIMVKNLTACPVSGYEDAMKLL